jgi:hypothetical protein
MELVYVAQECFSLLNCAIEKVLSSYLYTLMRKARKQGIWCKYCIHMYITGKMIPFETIPGIGVGE